MQNFTLKSQFQITGIGSASGLVFKDNSLFIISDNSSFLYQFDIPENKLTRIPLVENAQENIPKKDKYDFESITLKTNKLLLFGSGSTSKREKEIVYNLKTRTVEQIDLSKLYQKLKQNHSISNEDLNIEGALFLEENLLLFQRGNGGNSKNGIFKINNSSKSVETQYHTELVEVQLPKIKHVESSFTDAILVEDKIYFLATAEDTTSTYDDGEILGSLIGRIDIKTMEIDFTQKISDSHKFEGLTLYNKTEDKIEFLLCEDNDTEVLETTIFKLLLTN